MKPDRRIKEVSVGDKVHEISIPITLQRLVMEAGANRDLSLIHHDHEVARETGAPGAYASTFFLMGMFERLLREWMGPSGRVVKLGPLKMTTFNVVGDTMRFTGEVSHLDPASGEVILDLATQTEKGRTATCKAQISLNN